MSLKKLEENLPLYSQFEYWAYSLQKLPQADAYSVFLSEVFSRINKNSFEDNITIEINNTTQERKIIGNNNTSQELKIIRKKRKLSCEKNKKTHTKFDKDNLIRTIQVDYSRFIVKFINEILDLFDIEDKFYKIDYECTKNVKNTYFKNLKEGTIGAFLCQKISPRYKNHDADNNKNLYKEILNKNDIVNKILSENYTKLFTEIYLQNKREIEYCGKKIFLSPKVKTFKDFLDKEKYDNKYREAIQKAVENFYLKEPQKKPQFIIEN